MIRRLVILTSMGLVSLAPIVASAQVYGGGGGGYGNPSVDSGFDEMLQYQIMMETQQRLRLQQKKALTAKQNRQSPRTSLKAATTAADSKKKKPPEKLSRAHVKSETGSTKGATTKTATTPETKTPAKAKRRGRATPTKTASEPSSSPR